MFSFAMNKNSYLQSYYKDINPRLINRCVQKAWDYQHIDEHDLEPPFNRLTSEQPSIPIENVDVTRRPVGFGKCAMRKLRRELHHKDITVVIAAIESICDLVHDPERGYEAVKIKIIDRMMDLICDDTPAIREKTCHTLAVLARLAEGREALVANKILLENIAICVEDPIHEVRIHAAALLEMIAHFWKAADELVDFGFINILLSNLINEDDDAIVEIHLKTLTSLLYAMKGKHVAMDNDGFNIFIGLLENQDPQIISRSLECLSLLTATCIGERFARDVDLLNIVKKYLFDERPAIHTNAAAVIMFCTISTKGKICASKIKHITKRLVQLCRNKLNPSTQIYAIKALTNICEHPEIRKEVQKKYFDHIENIQIGGDPCIKKYKDILLNVIGWVASSST